MIDYNAIKELSDTLEGLYNIIENMNAETFNVCNTWTNKTQSELLDELVDWSRTTYYAELQNPRIVQLANMMKEIDENNHLNGVNLSFNDMCTEIRRIFNNNFTQDELESAWEVLDLYDDNGMWSEGE